MKQIPVAGPSITSKEISYVTDAVTNGWYEHANDYILKFEKSFAAYCNRKFSFSLPSCTSGLHLSLAALNIGPGDEVIVPDATWIASAAPITYLGATPVFADIDPKTWCLSAKTIEKVVSSKTKAIIVVNLYGHMAEWDDIMALSRAHNIPVIEDAAESIGSRFNEIPAGQWGVASCFSFHGSKTMTTGEGGMVVTDDETLAAKIGILRDHGRNPGDTMFRNIEVGYKYKMSPLQAALGLAQLERLTELVSQKRNIFSWYQKHLAGQLIELNPSHSKTFNSYWMSTILLPKTLKTSKEEVIVELKKQGINTRPFFDPLSSLIAYKNFSDSARAQKMNSVSYDISQRGINLPSALNLTENDIANVTETLVKILASKI